MNGSTAAGWKALLADSTAIPLLGELYGGKEDTARKRILALLESLPADREILLFSTPGRTELGGNHTDHNHGRVLAAAVDLDVLAAVAPRDDALVRLTSAGFEGVFEVDLERLEPDPAEEGRFEALIRGVAARFAALGYRVGGFEGAIESRVLPGSGLSSSAAVEVLIGTILSHLYNGGSVAPAELAKIGQFAENQYFGKPCGLMDQTACAVGGIVAIDFRDPENPEIEGISYGFEERGYLLAVVDTGGNHADLTPDYAACPAEMFAVAAELGVATARDIDYDRFRGRIPELRERCGDRAILRVFHFFAENRRAGEMIEALRRDDLPRYLRLMRDSGDSSWKLLQNCFTVQNPAEQGITLGVTVGRESVGGEAAFRVHGGGFAGTIQALVPAEDFSGFETAMEAVFGAGCVTRLRIRNRGTVAIEPA